jgi:HPt (histidine-containing phosphotransfer) domain-containing protein
MHAASSPEELQSPADVREAAASYLRLVLNLEEGDVVELLSDGSSNVRACLDSARRTPDKDDFAAHAHALKGNLINMGLTDLAARAKAMERAARSGQMGQALELLGRLEADLAGL